MENVLLKMARQLDALDEASLTNLWEQYANKVAKFEPSKRWEEAVLVLCLIQAKHWKNQLFNQNYATYAKPDNPLGKPASPFLNFSLEKKSDPPRQRATVLQFRPRTSPVHADPVPAENAQASDSGSDQQ